MLEIGIVGIGCRFPGGASSPQEFWEFLIAKGDGISDVPADRWNIDRFYDPDPDAPGRMYTRRGGFLTQPLWDFDPEYFGISPREASIMDPQQRLLLEVAVEALDDAGLSARVGGRDVGVYVGGFTSDNMAARHSRSTRVAINSHTPTSSTFTMLSNRLSYVLDLHGPSMTIDTACSSSLVAIHQAAQAIARGECALALAGGVNAMLQPETFISMCKGRFLAPDGRCKTFDAAADGYARGEGAGIIVLKPLAAAQADGDRVYAVIRGSGSNQDGRTSGITVPNPVAQAALARRVLRESGLQAGEIGYVEAHGTGTAIGDPLELQALGAVYGDVADRHTPLVVGSVKASVGHMEAAAGVASVIKAALTVHHAQIAPQAWLRELNPAIPFEQYRITIPTEAADFPARYHLPAAAVNGFGYGGTNAHVILTAAATATDLVDPSAGENSRAPRPVIALSARSDTAVREVADRLADRLQAGVDPEAVQAALWSRRLHHPVRTAFAWSDSEDLQAQLRACASGEGRAPSRAVVAHPRPPAFVFSGMGPQWWRMGRDLLADTHSAFAGKAAEIDAEFGAIAGWSIIEELRADAETSRIARTEIAQPANFLVQVALVAELAAVGIVPAVVLGHSVGEVSAAYVSGALSLHDALLVSYHRARLQATTAGSGGMLAVGLPEAEARRWLPSEGAVSVAAVNSPSSVTLAGTDAALAGLSRRLVEEGIFARALKVEVPYHSHLMDPILDEIRAVLAAVTPQAPSVALYSSVTAAAVTDASWGAEYWVDNVRAPVRFADAMGALIEADHRVFLEIGPHPVLGGNIREILVRAGATGSVVPTLVREQDDRTSLDASVVELYRSGALDPDAWVAGQTSDPVAHVDLPAYPWQRTRLWTEVATVVADRLGPADRLPLLGDRSDAESPVWELELAPAALPWLPDHVVDGLVLLPGAAYLDAALSAASRLTARDSQALADVRFVAPRIIDAPDVASLRLSVQADTGRFTIDSHPAIEASWTTNARGRIVDAEFTPRARSFAPPAGSDYISGPDLYAALESRGLHYGPAFQTVTEVWTNAQTLIANLDAAGTAEQGHLAHPTVLDGALQCVAALLARGRDLPEGPIVPAGVRSVRRYGALPERPRVVVERLNRAGLWADIALAGADGEVVLELVGVEFRAIRATTSGSGRLDRLWYEQAWERQGRPSSAPAADVLARGSAVVVSIGRPSATAEALAAIHPRAESVRVSGSAESALGAGGGAEVGSAIRRALVSDLGPVTVVVVAPHCEEPDVHGVAGLLATAVAVQLVLDDYLLDGHSTDGAPGSRPAIELHGVVVSEQAFGLVGDIGTVQLGASGLVGIRRTLRNEQPDVSWRLVDVEAGTPDGELAAEVYCADPTGPQDEIALRGGLRLAIRLRRNVNEHLAQLEVATPMTDPDRSFRVEAPTSMLMRDLGLREVARVAPGPGQVEVRLLSAGLNYKDSAKVIGRLTERELAGTYFGTALGMEAIGRVVRVGSGVTRHRVGDRLSIGMRDSLARYLTIDVDRGGVVSPAPTPWSDTDSALNLPFLTAHHCLVDAARLSAGETVLIQGAAGGVGLAAIQVAQRAGAIVIGTAGTAQRRAAVLEAGADYVLDSRSLNFVEEVRGLTGGEGADVVLNSAPGEVIGANLEAAAEFGRVIEIGKADIYQQRVLPLEEFDRNLSFVAVDIDRMLARRRPAVLALVDTVNAAFESGWYVPLPVTVYPLDRLAEAFEAVARGSHVGRVVLSFDDPAPLVRPAVPRVAIDSNASYLITGGFGAFGLATARWLVACGARRLVLVGRSGAGRPGVAAQIAGWRSAGVDVREVRADVGSPEQVGELLDGITPAVRGVFHAAGVLDDRPFTEIDAASLRAVFGPKAVGAWNLHRALLERGVELDYFVVYSSATAVTGTVPQANYAAANAVLDSLIHLRRGLGLPGLTVNWGSLTGGMADSSHEVERYLSLIGLGPIDIDAAARMLGQAMALGVTQVGIIDIDWAKWGATHPASAATTRMAEHIAAAGAAGSETAQLRAELGQLEEPQRIEVIAYMLAEQLATVLGIPADRIDLGTALPDLGLDSLMAVEMQARVNLALGVEISALEFGRGGGLSDLATRILGQFDLEATPATRTGVGL